MKQVDSVLVTGGAGYVGAMLVPRLLEVGYAVTVVDLMIYGDHVLPKDHPKLSVETGDIRDIGLLNRLMPGHDAVIHLACISNDPSFELNPELGKSINLDALEEWCREYLVKEKIPEKWFILDEIPKTDRGKINRDIVASICQEQGMA